MANIIETTDNNFQKDVLNSEAPVLVDFWASWCGPCRMLAPILEEVSASLEGNVKFVKIDIDNNQEIAAEYKIRSIPTLILFKNGEKIATSIGGLSKPQLLEFLHKNLI